MSNAATRESTPNAPSGSLESGIDALRGRAPDQLPFQKGRMVVYVPGTALPQDGFVSLGPPEAFSGKILAGDIQIFARFDYIAGNMTCGVFQSKGIGRAKVILPFTEHATILYGEVTMTDDTGRRHVYREGDSYLMKQGTGIIWEQTVPLLQKSFFNIRED